MTRRNFVSSLFKFLGVSFITGTAMVESGCNILADIQKYVPLGLSAFSSVVGILTSAGVLGPAGPAIQLVIVLVKAGFADLETVITEYHNAPASQKQTTLQKVSLVLSEIVGNMQQFWSDLKIPDTNLASMIQGLLGVIISTLSYFIGNLPTPTATVAKKSYPKMIVAPPVKRSPKQFKSDFDSLIPTKYQQFTVK